MLGEMNYRLSDDGEHALGEYITRRRERPHFPNARSIRNALDRARLRQANRLFEEAEGPIGAEALTTIHGEDLRASRIFTEALPGQGNREPA